MSIDNILEDTIQRFFTEDISFNYLREWINTPPIFETIPNPTPEQSPQQEEEEEDEEIPDLIDPITGRVVTPPVDEGLRLWTNVIRDYDAQIRLYQENIRTILDITQTFLPQRRIREPASTRPNNSYWTNILRNNGITIGNNAFTIDMERIFPSYRSNVPPTDLEIENATTTFVCDLSNNPLTSNICPISLEDFQNGESLTRILHCRHVFKTAELTRWFTRNSHCPTCRYDIRRI